MVIGGSSGIGRATVRALLDEGARVTAVARGAERLSALHTELGEQLSIRAGDATDAVFLQHLMRETRPSLVVLAAGVTPRMGAFEAFDWDAFSATWNTDVKATFHLVQEALQLPLAPGSTIVLVSSGAAVNGSLLSGGYAGAKRTQWMLADYAQRLSNARTLGLRFVAVLPGQLVEGTTIGANAAAAYGAMNGITPEAHMKRFGAPLDGAGVAAAIMTARRARGVRARLPSGAVHRR